MTNILQENFISAGDLYEQKERLSVLEKQVKDLQLFADKFSKLEDSISDLVPREGNPESQQAKFDASGKIFEKLKECDLTLLELNYAGQMNSITQDVTNTLMVKIKEMTAQQEKDIKALQEKVFASSFNSSANNMATAHEIAINEAGMNQCIIIKVKNKDGLETYFKIKRAV